MLFKINSTEKILLETRRHRFILYSKVGKFTILFSFALLAFIATFSFLQPESPLQNVSILVLLIVALFLWEFVFIAWLDYHLDVWIVTTERIVDIELLGLFRMEVSEFKLSTLQDVSVDVHGILHTFFNFGDVQIQTAGSLRQFVFEEVPHPHEIKKLILDAYDAHTKDLRLHPHVHQSEAI